MSEGLGGLLPLLRPDELNAEQRSFYEQLQQTMLPWAKESGFEAADEQGSLLGPFNAMLYSPVAGAGQMAYLKAEKDGTSLTARQREIVILTVGAVWKSSYELYAHRAVAARVGFSQHEIAALACGDPADGMPREEELVQRVSYKLATDHTLDPVLFQEAVDALGHKGLIDLVHLAGIYMTVATLLNTFAVPAPPPQS